MSLTLNQIVKQITNYANQHAQINSVVFGEFYNKLSDEDIVYTAFFFNISQSEILERQIRYTFEVYILDRQLQETNGLEVLSDTTLIAQDIVSLLRNNSNPWIIGTNIPINYFVEYDPDYVAGVSFNLDITISNINNRCEVPIV
jgi:hypothetical protein